MNFIPNKHSNIFSLPHRLTHTPNPQTLKREDKVMLTVDPHPWGSDREIPRSTGRSYRCRLTVSQRRRPMSSSRSKPQQQTKQNDRRADGCPNAVDAVQFRGLLMDMRHFLYSGPRIVNCIVKLRIWKWLSLGRCS